MIKVIIAVDKEYGFGCDGKLPWHIPSEMKYFVSQIRHEDVLMGLHTWESIPNKLTCKKPFVCTRSKLDNVDTVLFDEIDDFLAQYKGAEKDICIIGGVRLITGLIDYVDYISYTLIDDVFPSDVKFDPSLLDDFYIENKKSVENIGETKYDILILKRKRGN